MERKHYDGIDWLRTIACICIVLMHMRTNNDFELHGFVADRIILSFADFVFLFMTVSAFGMCAGYYENVMSGKVDWIEFYKKRYKRILPFFSVVVLIDIIYHHDINALIEAVPNLTMTRGLFPNDIEQIGVAWFLGVVFIFYMIFPFYCVMISHKRNAWIALFITMLLNYIVRTYYEVGRQNIVYCMMYFVAGGLIYLYRDHFDNKWRIILPIACISVVSYYLLKGAYAGLFVSASMLLLAISMQAQYNKFIAFVSEISMEVYLSHMVVFRIIEKTRINTMFGNGWVQYIMTSLVVMIGTVCFVMVTKRVLERIGL